MVDSQTDLGAAGAHQNKGQEVVADQVTGGMVGGVLGAFSGTETKSRHDGPGQLAIILLSTLFWHVIGQLLTTLLTVA